MTKKPALNNAINTNLRLIGTLTFKSNYIQVSVQFTSAAGKKKKKAYRHGNGHDHDIRRDVQRKTDDIVEIVLDPAFLYELVSGCL